MSSILKVHAPYPPVPPFDWPKEGERTWLPAGPSYFGACTGRPSCDNADSCPVGVRTVGSGVYGCDCVCHLPKRARLAEPNGDTTTRQREGIAPV